MFNAASGLWCRTCPADKSSQTIQKITWVSLIELLESREPHQITRTLRPRSSVSDASLSPPAGRDFSHDETLDVPTQVELLIKQATSHENLCQCYIGWSVLLLELMKTDNSNMITPCARRPVVSPDFCARLKYI